MTDPYFTIVNPAAGGGRAGKLADAALARLREAGIGLEVHPTRGPGDATDMARRAWDEGHRRFLAVGGDGTSYEIVNGLFPRAEGDDVPVLGMLPLGTGNSFLRDFRVTSAEDAMAALERGHERPCDVVRATHGQGALHYINLLSVGFSAQAGELTNRRFKPFGAAGYIAAVLMTAARLEHPVFPIRIDDGALDSRPCVLLSFSNSRYTAGTMMMAPSAEVGDGALDVVRVGSLGRVSFIKTFPSIFTGQHVRREGIEAGRARRVDLELDRPVDVMVDGEVKRLTLQRLDVLPHALRVVA